MRNCRASFDCLLQVRYAEQLGVIREGLRNFSETMSVGIRLNHRQERNLAIEAIPRDLCVMAQSRKIDFGPAAK
jgi:hypothetical protein